MAGIFEVARLHDGGFIVLAVATAAAGIAVVRLRSVLVDR